MIMGIFYTINNTFKVSQFTYASNGYQNHHIKKLPRKKIMTITMM
jgi:hypothetical protein